VRIDEHLAGRLVDSQFPEWAHLPIAPVESDGWDNRTFRLGPDLTLRLPSGDWYALQVEKEQRWLPILAPRLPLPIPLPVAQGEPAEGYPYAWSVYRWLDGEIATEPGIGDLTGSRRPWPGSSSRSRPSTPTAAPGPVATISSAAARWPR
jgi:aminoglycoside phosphotransferase (APT) family kinase protein